MTRELAQDAAEIADRGSMIRLEGGTFMMGSDRHYLDAEVALAGASHRDLQLD